MSENSRKVIWIQVSLEARGCRLHRSKRGSGCCCGTAHVGKFFWDTWYMSSSGSGYEQHLIISSPTIYENN